MIDMSIENPVVIEQSRMVGQRAAIRYFNPKDQEDVSRLFKIVSDPQVQEWMDEVKGMTMKDVIAWSRQRAKGKQEECTFAISGSPGFVKSDEVGEVQGFVNSYEIDKKLKEIMIADGNMIQADPDRPVIELSYARNPQTKPGQMTSGLVQVCFQLNEMMSTKQKEDGELSPSLQIVSFVEENNLNSIKLLEQSGFIQVGKVRYNKNDTNLSIVYRLNWEKAQSFLHREADKILKFKKTF